MCKFLNTINALFKRKQLIDDEQVFISKYEMTIDHCHKIQRIESEKFEIVSLKHDLEGFLEKHNANQIAINRLGL